MSHTKNTTTKLTETQVRAIRRLYRQSERPSCRAIGKQFNVSGMTVNNIVSRRQWAHVPDEEEPQVD